MTLTATKTKAEQALSRNFERVTAVEIGQNSYDDLAANCAVPHIQAVHSTVEDYLNAARGRWDFAIADPPRAGLGERAAKSLRLRSSTPACD